MKKINFEICNDTEELSLNKSMLKQDTQIRDFFKHTDFVDLDLPSGTLWAKFNLGVDPNNLNKPKDWYGNYYAWAETEIKNTYTLENYKFINPVDASSNVNILDHITKYTTNCNYSNNTHIDNKCILDKEDDIANITYGGNVHIPSKEQIDELVYETEHKCYKNYKDIFDLNGIEFIGKNHNSIFIPFAGGIKTRNGKNTPIVDYEYGCYGYLWSSTIHKCFSSAYCLEFKSSDLMDLDDSLNHIVTEIEKPVIIANLSSGYVVLERWNGVPIRSVVS